jgi:hypothetical protein
MAAKGKSNRFVPLAVCAKSAQKYANAEQAAHKRCQPAVHRRIMADIITLQFRRSRLPRRLLNHDRRLESPPARPSDGIGIVLAMLLDRLATSAWPKESSSIS